MNPAAKIEVILALIKKSEPCTCERCGNEHKTEPGPLSGLSIEEIKKLIDFDETKDLD